MKKSGLFILLLPFLATLTSCNNETPVDKNKELLDKKEVSLKTALENFENDFSAMVTINNTRRYINPYFKIYDTEIDYSFFLQYDHLDNDLVRYSTTGSATRKDTGEVIELEPDVGVYNEKSNIIQDEFINYRNEIEFRNRFLENIQVPVTMETSLSKNIFKDLNLEDFILTVEEEPININSTFLNQFLDLSLGYNNELESLTATLNTTTNQISEIKFKYEDLENRYTSTSFDGDLFNEALEGTITFGYGDLTLGGKEVANNKSYTELETVLNKFKANPNNYTIYYGANENFNSRLLKNGDRMAIDLCLLSDSKFESYGTLSYLDARIEKDENNNYFINNLVIDETTGEALFKTNYDIINETLNTGENGELLPEEEQTKLNKEDFYVNIEDFDLDFKNINPNIFTKEGDSYVLTGIDAKYIGEVLFSKFLSYSSYGIVMNLEQYTWTGSKLTLKVVDENSIAFDIVCDLGWEGASAKSYMYGLITDPGSSDPEPIYTTEIPEIII